MTDTPKLARLRCWWFGCKSHPADRSRPETARCVRCNEVVSYDDAVGDTRHERFKFLARYWLLRRWWPDRCPDCGRRWHCDETIDHFPF